VIRKSGDIDVHVIRVDDGDAPPVRTAQAPPAPLRHEVHLRPYLDALGYTAAATAAAWALFTPPDLSTEAMIQLLGVVLAALRCGTGPSILSAILSALAFNFLFTEPRFSFRIDDPSYLVACGAMLLVGLAISTLVNRVRERAAAVQEHERESLALYSLTRELADAHTDADIARVTLAHLRDAIAGDLAFMVPVGPEAISAAGVLASYGLPDWLGPNEFGVARWCWLHGQPAGEGTTNLPGSAGLFLPLAARQGRNGVLAVRRAAGRPPISSKQRLLLETFAEQAALALERVRMADERQRARQEAETERLRSTLLASVSHDLRTPLAAITGAASSLADGSARLSEATRRELVGGILEQTRRLNDLIANLVFATRLESGSIELRKEWTSIEEVIGAALRRAHEPLRDHQVRVHVPPSLPLVQADPVLIEQGLYLLFENAASHTPKGSDVDVRAWAQDGSLLIEVSDNGPGIPEAERARVFRRFVRRPGSAGMGLGLPICEGIFMAHGGRAWAVGGRERGAAFRVLLPLPAAQPPRPTEAEVAQS
jgi:two-component system sensor histidine kinase KdpD